MLTNMSESKAKNELDSMDAGLGLYFLEINVEAESNDGLGCTTQITVRVEYLVEVILLTMKLPLLNDEAKYLISPQFESLGIVNGKRRI